MPKPEFSFGQALEKLEDYAKTKASEKFSNKEQAKREMELYNQARPFRKGEYIKTVDVSGKPVVGTFDGKSGGKVIIGGREILLKDIPATHRFRFDEAQAEKRAKEQLENFRKNFQNQKKDFQDKIIKEEKEAFLKSLGFIKTEKDDFMLPDEFVKQEIEKLKKKNDEKLKKKITEEKKKIAQEMAQEIFYKNNGFCKYQNKWMIEKEALENAIEDKRKKFDSDIQKKISDKTKSLTAEFEKKIYSSNGYVYYNNSWQPAKDLLNRLVEMELSAK